MCGIVGRTYPSGVPPPQYPTLSPCLRALWHRGPDEEGIYAGSGVLLGHRRLTILDPAHGHQPLPNETHTVFAMNNGEIYNAPSLRHELQALGHTFISTCDTEVAVHGYEQWGIRVVERLEGMFALAIWDERERRLILARDRFGMKPLYLWEKDGGLAFASTLPALLAFQDIPRELHYPALADATFWRYTPGPETLLKGIRRLPPASLLTWQAGKVEEHSYWTLPSKRLLTAPSPQLDSAFSALFGEALTNHLLSDVPLGIFLSGGLDSSLVAAIASRKVAEPLPAFSISFTDPSTGSEAGFAEGVARHLGIPLTSLAMGGEAFFDLLPKLIWYHGEPITEPAAIPTYVLARAAKAEVKTVLTGEGADELFGGYPKYRFDPLARWVPKNGRGLILKALEPWLRQDHRKRRAAQCLTLPKEQRWASWFASVAFSEWRELATPENAREAYDVQNYVNQGLAGMNRSSDLDAMLALDLRVWLPGDLLVKMDSMTMATGLEARIPFLDRSVVEWAFNLPDEERVTREAGKRILRRVAREYLPPAILERPKAGFPVPLAAWFRGMGKTILTDTLDSLAFRERNLYRPEVLERYLSAHMGGEDWSRLLWNVLTLELWLQKFIDGSRSGLEAPGGEIPLPAGIEVLG